MVSFTYLLESQVEPLHLRAPNLPDFNYYLDYLENSNNSSVLWKHEEKVNCVGFLPLYRTHSDASLTYWSYVSDIYSNSFSCFFPVEQAKLFLHSKEIKTISFRKPFWHKSLFLESIKGQVVRVRNYEESSIIDLNSYSCSSRRRKGVEIGEKLGYVFGEVIESERTEAIQALLDFGISKGIKMLPLNRFLYILERHGQFFKLFAVKSQDGRIVSCAITQAIDLCLRVPNYFGMRETKGSTDYLVHGLLTMAKEENFEILDLGSSTDPNSRKINQGIVQYKKEWGAKHCTIPTLSWIL